MKSKKRSLGKIINGMFLLVFMSALFFNSMILYHIRRLIEENRMDNAGSIGYQVGNYFSREMEKLIKIQDGVTNQALALNVLRAENREEEESARRVYRDYIYELQNYSGDLNYALLIDPSEEYKLVSQAMASEEFETVCRLENAPLKETDFNDVCQFDFFRIPQTAYQNSLYIVCYKPVSYYEEVSEGFRKKFAGVSIVVSKISTGRIMAEYKEWGKMELNLLSGNKNIRIFDFETARPAEVSTQLRLIGLNRGNWYIQGILYKDKYEKMIDRITLLTFAGTGAVLLLLILFQFVLKRMVSEPVRKIVSYLDSYTISSSPKLLKNVNGCREFSMIGEEINKMVISSAQRTKRIFEQQSRLYEYELVTNRNQLRILQGQINPHFLYNTLECIRILSILKDTGKVERITIAMSDIMRYTLKEGDEVGLLDEITISLQYLSIMKIRYADCFCYEVDLPQEVRNCRIIKMILQPVLENVFKYGLILHKKSNRVRISVAKESAAKENVIEESTVKENAALRIRVEDNGKGMTPERLKEVQDGLCREHPETETGNIGLYNVHSRLKMRYGEGYGIRIQSSPGRGTVVELLLPYLKK